MIFFSIFRDPIAIEWRYIIQVIYIVGNWKCSFQLYIYVIQIIPSTGPHISPSNRLNISSGENVYCYLRSRSLWTCINLLLVCDYILTKWQYNRKPFNKNSFFIVECFLSAYCLHTVFGRNCHGLKDYPFSNTETNLSFYSK